MSDNRFRWAAPLARAGARGLAPWVAAALVASTAAHAQRVVILEIEDDRGNRLREQIESALQDANVVEVVPLSKYKEAAARKKLKGAQAMSPAGVAKVAPALKFAAAVGGTAGRVYSVQIYDSAGDVLWTKDLPMRGGLISPDHAVKLARAIAVAAEQASAKPAPVEEEGEEEETTDTQVMPGLDISQGSDTSGTRPDDSTQTTYTDPNESERDADLEREGKRAKAWVGPKYVTLLVSGTTTWRGYCSRPGVQSCQEYDSLSEASRPSGQAVTFFSAVPYAGFNVGLQAFPLAKLDSFIKGLGVGLGYARGFSLILVKDSSAPGSETQITSIEEGMTGEGLFRFFFSWGDPKDALVGYFGVRGGVSLRNFEVDQQAGLALHGSHRLHPFVGAEVAIPLFRLKLSIGVPVEGVWRLEAGGGYFIAPKPGVDEIAGYGDLTDPTGGGTGRGFGFEAGLAGDVYGPVGLSVRFKHASYADQFFGKGQVWICDQTQCGGVAEESYSALVFGVTASY